MMLEKFFFNKITPYHRSFLQFQFSNGKIITLPAINSAVFFLSPKDSVSIDDYDYIEKLPYIDYQLTSEKEFKEEMTLFRQSVKDVFYENEIIHFFVERKMIVNNSVAIILTQHQTIE